VVFVGTTINLTTERSIMSTTTVSTAKYNRAIALIRTFCEMAPDNLFELEDNDPEMLETYLDAEKLLAQAGEPGALDHVRETERKRTMFAGAPAQLV
jgi:hypothetical protein